MKNVCCMCSNLAVWFYSPSDNKETLEKYLQCYYCDSDTCIKRGCSCNVIDWSDSSNGEEHRDLKGRLLPCVEYRVTSFIFFAISCLFLLG